MKTKSILAFCLCVLLICSLFLTACNKSSDTKNSTADEVSVTTTETQNNALQVIATTETSVKTTAPSETVTTETATTVPATTVPEKTTEAPKQETPQQNNNNNSNSNSNSNSGPVDTKPMKCIVTVAEKDYEAEVGDILTYTYYLKTPKMIENVQASVNYTPNCLQLLEDDIETSLPVINSGAIFNGQNQGVVNYNAIKLTGYDFTTEGVLITLRFKVIFGGSGAIANAIQFMDEKGAEVAYVDNFKMSDDITIREVLK